MYYRKFTFLPVPFLFFFFNPPPPPAFYPLSLHDALPICVPPAGPPGAPAPGPPHGRAPSRLLRTLPGGVLVPEGSAEGRSEEHTSELQSPDHLVCRLLLEKKKDTVTHSQW